MTKRIPQPCTELPTSVRVHEAKLLAVMLRTSRLTWVFGEPGTDKSALLRTGVVPLLQRRHGDRGAGPAAVADSTAAPERRRRQARPRSEVAIHFDGWGPEPLSALKRRISASVPATAPQAGGATLLNTLQSLHRQQGLHFVFLLDRFEEFLAMAADEAEVGQFADELIEVIAQDAVPASFLIAMDEAARPRLERFRARIPSFDHDVLRLSPVSDRSAPVQERPGAMADKPAHPPKPRRPPPRVPVKVEDVYALIESTLSRNRETERPADWNCDLELDFPEGVAPVDRQASAEAWRSDNGTAVAESDADRQRKTR